VSGDAAVTRRLLTGPAAQRVLRWAATALAFGGVGCDPPAAAKKRSLPVLQPNVVVDSMTVDPAHERPEERLPPIAGFPEAFGDAQACAWLDVTRSREHWQKELATLPPGDRAARRAKLMQLFGEEVAPPDTSDAAGIAAALEAAEKRGFFFEFLAVTAFQASEGLTGLALADVLARVERHARVAIALRRAESLTAPVVQRPWISKAGPPPCGGRGQVPADFVPEARKAYESGDAGSWDKDARLSLTLKSGSVALWRRGASQSLSQGDAIDLRRVDVLVAGASDVELEHPRLGRLVVPAGQALGPWNTAAFLGADARALVESTVKAAGDGDAAALDAVEAMLPAARTFVVAELLARPDAVGAPGLRLALALMVE
jgi:hypothetical protein